ncbi:hypothetical protein V6N11_012224 [Hibiscus sabdariffa]|uniref:RNase H type-1 domain-containing protein n=1 Tax=Hibiscus sabdariffa TaxID=183260 RepID=A0ABR2QAF5_9ROSI
MLDRNGQKVTTRKASIGIVMNRTWSGPRELDEATKLSSFEGGQMCHCTCKDDDNSVSEDEGAIQVDGNVRNLSQKGDHLQEAERVLGHEELLAIKKAPSLFAASGLAGDENLQVETDCNNVVAWFRQPSKTPNAFKDLVLECLTAHGKWFYSKMVVLAMLLWDHGKR